MTIERMIMGGGRPTGLLSPGTDRQRIWGGNGGRRVKPRIRARNEDRLIEMERARQVSQENGGGRLVDEPIVKVSQGELMKSMRPQLPKERVVELIGIELPSITW